ncbi:response regulator transcription factor [Gloeobacter morelensis]|uniref:Response regulator transcription factor n=1 Tax=Gloeobacter morelensis MG652769 TaxID=2781736 RepID=A0ABY3PSQ9_9CYAN|nr:response regulator transcription factor [Gloeobacter morelensis]UFP96751.1 response regulator transcription factor [Gloeobacter morelensis MG652769]
MVRILIAEDDERIAIPLAEDLTHQHYLVDVAADGKAAWHYASTYHYDVLLLDVMLPEIDGFALCRQLREAGYEQPILMLTALDRTTDRVAGLDSGADDYLVKPFSLEELGARVRALLRRSGPTRGPVLKAGPLSLDPLMLQATYGGLPLHLTPKEYRLLECLLRHPGQIFSRETLLDRLWEPAHAGGDDAVKALVLRLRRKLQEAGAPQDLLKTVHGFGYCFNRSAMEFE